MIGGITRPVVAAAMLAAIPAAASAGPAPQTPGFADHWLALAGIPPAPVVFEAALDWRTFYFTTDAATYKANLYTSFDSTTKLNNEAGSAWSLSAVYFFGDPAVRDWKEINFPNITDMQAALVIFDDGDETDRRWGFFRAITSCEDQEYKAASLPFLIRLLTTGSAPSRAAAAAAIAGSNVDGAKRWLADRLRVERHPLVRAVIASHLPLDLVDAAVPA